MSERAAREVADGLRIETAKKLYVRGAYELEELEAIIESILEGRIALDDDKVLFHEFTMGAR